ncbi:hypothetical protein E2C01_100862 [Portunus trituberculatus]|uniref:Uncharacterized protein n=1 Tax=Portunus trituberculatus TaxID=210409 RepID=A0A5B7K946_PORTR|nr:hypothetical protein [Portunus trituberculatus]
MQAKRVTRRSGRVATWCSQQSQSNLIATLSLSLQVFLEAITRQEVALTLKNLGSSSRKTRERQGASQSQRSCSIRSLTWQIQTQKIR